MGDEAEKRRREMHNLSLQIEKYPRDLLQRFMPISGFQQSQSQQHQHPAQNEEDPEEIELNLGLSLGGRFGVDKNKKLIRSSSIAGTIPIIREEEATTPPPVTYPTLTRASSLPTETEEEWRKRKELQTLRRMAAKRRRNEKQRNLSSRTEKMELNLEEDDKNKDKLQLVGASRGSLTAVAPAVWGRQAVVGGGASGGGFYVKQSSQGSVESTGGSSSGISAEMESRALQGSGSCGESTSPGSSNQSLQDESNQKAVGSLGSKSSENASRTPRQVLHRNLSVEKRARELGMNTMEDMPCVFAKGDGPNGKKIEGILYRYGRGEEVRIMCVCHGNFFSPAGFVKHAGGGDVDHPLRHIVVNPSSSFL